MSQPKHLSPNKIGNNSGFSSVLNSNQASPRDSVFSLS